MFDVMTLEKYLDVMNPYLLRIAGRHAWRGHPTLEAEDLRQEARAVLVEVWNRYAPRGKCFTELRSIGTSAMFNEVRNVIHKSFRHCGGDLVTVGVFSDAQADEADALLDRDMRDLAAKSEAVRAVMGAADTVPDGLPRSSLFQQAHREVHGLLQKRGYIIARNNNRTREGHMNAIIEPRDEELDEVVKAKAPKAKAPKAKAPKAKAPSISAAESLKAARAFVPGSDVVVRSGRLPVGSRFIVRGVVMCRGRAYVRCVNSDKRSVVLAPYAIEVK